MPLPSKGPAQKTCLVPSIFSPFTTFFSIAKSEKVKQDNNIQEAKSGHMQSMGQDKLLL